MRLRHLGYVGQNLSFGLTTGRTLRLANLSEERVAEVIGANLADLQSILGWNVDQGIGLFRIGSSCIPFASHEDFSLDWRRRFAPQLDEIAEFVRKNDLRISVHPGQYTVLNSPDERVAGNARAELEYHAHLLEALDPVQGSLVLHVGGAYGDKEVALARFIERARELPAVVRRFLTVENDDTTFDARHALQASAALNIPVVFDFLHHRHNPPYDAPENASDNGARDPLEYLLEEVVASWGDRVPKFHLSSGRTPGSRSHADYIDPEDLSATLATLEGLRPSEPYDLMLEAKAKDKAVLAAMEFLQSRARQGGIW